MTDVYNKFMVAVIGDKITVINIQPRTIMSKEEALVLAAWLVALADPLQEKFYDIFRAVEGT